MSVLEVKNLRTELFTNRGILEAVDNVSFSLEPGEILGLVGESGCGKSMSSMSIMRLLAKDRAKVTGEVLLDGVDLLRCSDDEINKIRGNEISMIFQDVMTSLNPLLTVGQQIAEPLMVHKKMSKAQARNEAIELLKAVGIPEAEKRYKEYPNALSGGMRQRVMIAIALSCKPKVLIADEPTTALDVTIQAQILELMKKIRDEYGTSIIMISHDLGVIAETCDRAAVMYCGSIVEQGTIKELFEHPTHPYTIGLLNCIPTLTEQVDELYNIPGVVPALYNLPQGCKFAERCPIVADECRMHCPEKSVVEGEHIVYCLKNGGILHE